MSGINEIMEKYTGGEITAEETNEQLRQQEAGFHLKPDKNILTEEEIRATTIGHYPEQANGFGLLDTGTGTMDKVQVQDGHLVDCDCGTMPALCIVAGRTYQVQGTILTERETETEECAVIPDRPSMKRRKDLAGQMTRQTTKSGFYDVTYDGDGYAVKVVRAR